MKIEFDNYIDGMAKFALIVPKSSKCYVRQRNIVREFLLDLAECVRAAALEHEKRKAAFKQGRKCK